MFLTLIIIALAINLLTLGTLWPIMDKVVDTIQSILTADGLNYAFM